MSADFPPFDSFPDQHLETQAVRSGTARTAFNEHAEALFLTSSFVFASAAEAALHFKPGVPGFVYSRFSNPTVNMFQERLAALEGAPACIATASGMSAIYATCLALLQSGDHVVSSRSIFGATAQLFDTILSRFGITTTYVDPTDLAAWQAALTPHTKLVYLETPSNPLGDVVDVRALKAITAGTEAALVVDNCLATPMLQRPFALGADIVVHSATKYIDGQGRVLGGAILGSRDFVDNRLAPILRTTGPSLSPFNAWVLLKGLETLALRMERQCASALALAQWLEAQPEVARVYYPGLPSHPQHALAMAQQRAGGAVLSFEVRGDDARAMAWRVIDGCRLLSITGNLGDTRTTITHPATTTHGRLSEAQRAAAGIGEGLVRVSVGLEHPEDVKADLARGLKA